MGGAVSGHCRDCQHYGPPLPVNAKGYDKHGDKDDHPTYGYCQLASAEMQDNMVFGPDRPTLAFAVDGEEYRAGLRVHPDFGCVQWERKP